MNVEIILRDDEGRRVEHLSMDCEASDLSVGITRDERTAAESQMVEWARYVPPGPQPSTFNLRLRACADNLKRTVGEPVTRREKPRLAEPEFLRDLAEILHYVPVVHGVDSGHVEALNEVAERFDALEQEIQGRANGQLQLVADKERLIYWLLQAYKSAMHLGDEAATGIEVALDSFGYAWGSDRARRMLDLGEPALRSTTS